MVARRQAPGPPQAFAYAAERAAPGAGDLAAAVSASGGLAPPQAALPGTAWDLQKVGPPPRTARRPPCTSRAAYPGVACAPMVTMLLLLAGEQARES